MVLACALVRPDEVRRFASCAIRANRLVRAGASADVSACEYVDVETGDRITEVLYPPSEDEKSSEAVTGGAPEQALKALTTALGVQEFARAWQEFDAFVADDKGFDPQLSPPGTPEIPSACVENESCAQCYGAANRKLEVARRSLEKIRANTRSWRIVTVGGDAVAMRCRQGVLPGPAHVNR